MLRINVIVLATILMTINIAHCQQLKSDDFNNEIRKSIKINGKPTTYTLASPVFFTRDIGEFDITNGKIITLPLDNGFEFAILKGEGYFAFTPPLNVEQSRLKQVYGTPSFQEELVEAYIFSGSNKKFKEIENGVQSNSIDEKIVTDAFNKFLNDAIGHKKSYSNIEVIETILNHDEPDFFRAEMSFKNGKRFSWNIFPKKDEAIEFERLSEQTHILGNNFWETICAFNSNEIQYENKFKIEKYEMDCDFVESKKSNVKTTFFYNSKTKHDWLLLDIEYTLLLKNVTYKDQPLKFYKGEQSSYFFIQSSSIEAGSGSIILEYSGNIVEHFGKNSILNTSSIGWYPRMFFGEGRSKTDFDITFRIPEKYSLYGVGKRISEVEENEIKIIRMQSEDKMRNYSFNIGKFKTKEISESGLPKISMSYITPDNHKFVIDIAKSSLMFYSTFFGPLKYDNIGITQLTDSYFRAEAFPGFVHLPENVFTIYSGYMKAVEDAFTVEGEWESMISHEIAHQWWGIGVDFVSYRDQWLSEAFAEYSSLLFLSGLEDKSLFHKLLNNSKKTILNELVKDEKQAGIISLGYRNNLSREKVSSHTVLYDKGAWVLHMIRNILLDLNTMNEDMFLNIMKEFYQKHNGKSASTNDFRALLESKTGIDMEWFFNQWVDGTAIPKYIFSYNSIKTPEGKYIIKCRVNIERVPENFQMYVPIEVKYDDVRMSRFRVGIAGNYAEFDLPAVPLEPSKIIFNTLNSVLCEVEEKEWVE